MGDVIELLFPKREVQASTQEGKGADLLPIIVSLLTGKTEGVDLESKLREILNNVTSKSPIVSGVKAAAASITFSILIWVWWTVLPVFLLLAVTFYLVGAIGGRGFAGIVFLAILLLMVVSVGMGTVLESKFNKLVLVVSDGVSDTVSSIIPSLSEALGKLWSKITTRS